MIQTARSVGYFEGADAVLQLRNEFGAAIPALIISGDTGSAAERRVLDAGLALLPKPVVAATLKSAALALVAVETLVV